MTKHRNALVVGVAALSLTAVPSAWAGHSQPHYTGHKQTTTTSCSGGSSFTTDGNAFFGQQRETEAWNEGDHGTTCEATLDD